MSHTLGRLGLGRACPRLVVTQKLATATNSSYYALFFSSARVYDTRDGVAGFSPDTPAV